MIEKVDSLVEPPGVESVHEVHQLSLVHRHHVPANGGLDLVHWYDVGTFVTLSREMYLFIV